MINILSKETIDKIAAGEVAERPESVVKELLDNSIDSGATVINIELKKGGTELIRVTDNGSGIEKEDVRPAFFRHATSKLKTAEDLMHISTMGFRGEALNSIAAVSRVEMITKVNDSLTGILYRIESGKEKLFTEVGAPTGTTVAVKDFLYSVPVRRQFLKSAQTETSYALNTAEIIALAHPEISISFIADGRNMLSTPGSGRMKDVIYIVYGSNTAANLIEIDQNIQGIRVLGYAVKPVINRSRRDEEIFFVNGRPVKSDVLTKAAEDAFSPYMMQHRFPVFFLNVEIDTGQVDVNIHPRKAEVRFSDPQRVYNAVFETISNAIEKKELVIDAYSKENKTPPAMHAFSSKNSGLKTYAVSGKDAEKLRIEPYEINKKYEYIGNIEEYISGSGHNNAYNINSFDKVLNEDTADYKTDGHKVTVVENGTLKNDDRASEAALINKANADGIRLIGQIFKTYWIIEYKDEMYLIDQHAAHEKVNYERYMRLMKTHSISSQMLYPPLVITLGSKEAMLLDKNLETFYDMGYEIDHAGDRDYVVRAVPSNVPEIGEKKLLMDMIESIFEDGGNIGSELLKDKIASMSCKAAIKGGDEISYPEMKALIEEMFMLDNPYACPHGRPTIIKWSKYDIEKLFKRIV